MQIIDCEQTSDEWFEARDGIPTASGFRDLITSQGKKTSSSTFNKLINTLAAELLGVRQPAFETEWMRRGKELEPQARAFYEFERDVTVEEVGFCLLDDRSAGASPDGLMPDCGLEIKCPAPHTHVGYLAAGKLPAEHLAQVQGCMWVCERDHWDFLSFHPELPELLLRVDRDQTFIDSLSSLVAEVNEKVQATLEKVRKYQ